MPKKRFDSRELRQLAEQLLEEMAKGEAIPAADRRDLATSLVRQWITYAGNATLFFGERQLYLVLAKTPRGAVSVIPEPAFASWINRLIQDWKISPDELPPLISQLNLGQTVETINSDGLPIRLWVNPKEKSKGVEPLITQPVPPGKKLDYRKIAGDQLEEVFGSELEPRAMDELARSVATQWQQHEGHACLFFKPDQQLSLTLTEHPDGGCDVLATRESANLESLLSSLGVPPEIIPHVIARINLGQEVEFQDRKGVRSVLGYDPKTKRVRVKVLPLRQPVKPSDLRPICCPKCGAVLMPQVGNEPPEPCPMCGHVV
jgi:hypothetical protein